MAGYTTHVDRSPSLGAIDCANLEPKKRRVTDRRRTLSGPSSTTESSLAKRRQSFCVARAGRADGPLCERVRSRRGGRYRSERPRVAAKTTCRIRLIALYHRGLPTRAQNAECPAV